MKTKEIMKPVIKTSADSTVSNAAKIMDIKNIGSLPVEENGKLIGIITERDILRKIVAKGRNPEETPVRDIMSSPLITIGPEEDIEEANNVMIKHKIRRLAVESNGKIIGIITMRDVSNSLKYLLGKRILGSDETKYYGHS